MSKSSDDRAIRGLREMGSDWHASMLGLGFALAIGVSEPEALAAAEQAREVFERVRARPWVERTDAILSGKILPILAAESVPEEAPIP